MRVRDLPEETKLIQLAEEASELAQAALKLIRARRGDTPVSEHQAVRNLFEEIADVNVCLVAIDPDPYTIEAIMRDKACRWERRINGEMDSVCGTDRADNLCGGD